ncbi:MAG: M67 family metallopeptidase [Tannerella sp.]|jgi:proteasome lid subunit RPN8/RPN11|nr:M67 family metallopeptidase [Tannerella sp.]
MIAIPQHIIDGIIAQALGELPDEACGLLVGKRNVNINIDGIGNIDSNGNGDEYGSEAAIRYPLTNVDHSPEHFSFDPKEQFAVLREARAQKLQIIANYHSHPGTPARPSEEDIRLAFDPDTVYIIVSLQEKDRPVIKAFSIREKKAEETVIIIK